MFAKSSFVVTFALIASATAFSAGAPLSGSCDSARECSVIFNNRQPDAQALCGSRTTEIAWRKDTGALLIQCVGSATDQEDYENYIVNGTNITGLVSGRNVTVDYLQQNPNADVPDKFGAVPLCSPAQSEKLRVATFVLLNKLPIESTASPYCYDVTYLSVENKGFRVETNKGVVPATDRNHFLDHISAATKSHIAKVIDAFQSWKDQQHK